jgi:hypothetical protein
MLPDVNQENDTWTASETSGAESSSEKK